MIPGVVGFGRRRPVLLEHSEHGVVVERIGRDIRMHPIGALDADVRLPGSKSLTNRYLTCAALADEWTTLSDVAICDDTDRMLAGLKALGVDASLDPRARTIAVDGCGGHVPATEAEIDAGAAGTAMRFLTALACAGHGQYRLDGSFRMRNRPLGPLLDALRSIGARIGCERAEGYPPIVVHARGLAGGTIEFDRPPSSQFVSALLMIAPCCGSDVFVDVNGPLTSRPYVEMTIGVMRSMGVEVLETGGQRFVVAAPQRYAGGHCSIEPDASAASYFWAAAAVTGGRVGIVGLTLRSAQGDAAFVNVLGQMGCRISESEDGLTVTGPPRGELCAIECDLNAMPDTVQTLAVVALFARGTTTIRNVANLRIKETDRLAALGAELVKFGARIELRPDGLTIDPPAKLTPAAVDTYDDHRMAMSFAVAGLAVSGVTIRDARVVSKSFPDFFETLAEIGARP